jgi:hypothetical protein
MIPPPYEELDRGFDHVCWIPTNTTLSPPQKNSRVKRWFESEIGIRASGALYQHLCERFKEPNRCSIYPGHIIIGTKSSNAAHMHELRVSEGIPWDKNPRKRRGPYKMNTGRCSVDGCPVEAPNLIAKGMCGHHYYEQYNAARRGKTI